MCQQSNLVDEREQINKVRRIIDEISAKVLIYIVESQIGERENRIHKALEVIKQADKLQRQRSAEVRTHRDRSIRMGYVNDSSSAKSNSVKLNKVRFGYLPPQLENPFDGRGRYLIKCEKLSVGFVKIHTQGMWRLLTFLQHAG